MITAKKWEIQKFERKLKLSNYKLVEEEILPDALTNAEVCVEAVYLSVDPYMRHFSDLGKAVVGEQVAKVIKSSNSKFPEGTLVRISCGWRTHTVVKDVSELTPIDYIGSLPPSVALGVLGMPGAAAYLAVNTCDPRPGETILVTGAAGAVGSVAGQIVKIKGCRVIGSTGSEEKCKWLKELGFDEVLNYKNDDLNQVLNQAAPDGIDCYLDGVGGEFTDKVIDHIKREGRIVNIGSISTYHKQSDAQKSSTEKKISSKKLKVHDFGVFRCKEKWPAAFGEILDWITQDKLTYRETITEGFEKMPEAFIGLFEGTNIGKAIVKV